MWQHTPKASSIPHPSFPCVTLLVSSRSFVLIRIRKKWVGSHWTSTALLYIFPLTMRVYNSHTVLKGREKVTSHIVFPGNNNNKSLATHDHPTTRHQYEEKQKKKRVYNELCFRYSWITLGVQSRNKQALKSQSPYGNIKKYLDRQLINQFLSLLCVGTGIAKKNWKETSGGLSFYFGHCCSRCVRV